jgi:ribosomal protein L37AE/L43A
MLRYWGYYKIQTMIKYKAEAAGIKILFVDPAYTSQTCSNCGNLEDGQRISQSEFKCKKCEFSANADFNAALNISRKEEIKKEEESKTKRSNKFLKFKKPDSRLKSEGCSLDSNSLDLPTSHSLTLNVQGVV